MLDCRKVSAYSVLSGWAYIRNRMPFCKNNVAKKEVGVCLKWAYFRETTVVHCLTLIPYSESACTPCQTSILEQAPLPLTSMYETNSTTY